MTEELSLDKKEKERKSTAFCSRQVVTSTDENKSSCRAKNLPMSPSIIQGKAFFSSAVSRGARSMQGLQPWHAVRWRLVRPCWARSPSLSSVYTSAGLAASHFLSSRHWNLKLRPSGIDELSGDPAELSGTDILKWAGPGKMPNSLILEGTATCRWPRHRADRCTPDNVCSHECDRGKVIEGFRSKWIYIAFS